MQATRDTKEFKDDAVYSRKVDAPVLEHMTVGELQSYAIKLEQANAQVVDAHNKLIDDAEETISERIRDLQQANKVIEILRDDFTEVLARESRAVDSANSVTEQTQDLKDELTACKIKIRSLRYLNLSMSQLISEMSTTLHGATDV